MRPRTRRAKRPRASPLLVATQERTGLASESSSRMPSGSPWSNKLAGSRCLTARSSDQRSSCCWRQATRSPLPLEGSGVSGGPFGCGVSASRASVFLASRMRNEAGARPAFPPETAAVLVKLACELPDTVNRSLSLWTCAELARALQRDGVVDTISPQSVQRILLSQQLKPWRIHYWLSSQAPLDAAFRAIVLDIQDLYTRQLLPNERVMSLDEKTSMQPRPRPVATKAPRRQESAKLEATYKRCGALNLLAAFDTRTGEVIGVCRRRKRQVEFIELLEEIDRLTPEHVTVIHLVCDNIRIHKGKLTSPWLARHPRFQMHFTPVHCSWMNQIEQWFSIIQRKRLSSSNFADLTVLEQRLLAFIKEWNETAHPFKWTSKSFQKILAKVEAAIARAA